MFVYLHTCWFSDSVTHTTAILTFAVVVAMSLVVCVSGIVVVCDVVLVTVAVVWSPPAWSSSGHRV